MFRVSNIIEQAVGEEGFERPEDFDLPLWWAAELQRFEAELRPNVVQLRASPLGLKRLAELGAYATEAVRSAGAADGDGWASLSLPIENSEHAALALLGVGPELEVLAPASLRGALKHLATRVAQLAEKGRT